MRVHFYSSLLNCAFVFSVRIATFGTGKMHKISVIPGYCVFVVPHFFAGMNHFLSPRPL